ncbi:hypothetical protein [Novosphingobium malaysiense]|uniref:hypothetical protein n=1 Tax=Novosphingobium malaysiense TaxID=1348853 RepID=UPI00068D935D|nr:hypothetical protein [Novosphingobium malaysiense]
MIANALLTGGCASVIAGVAVLRAAWARPRRRPALNTAGWGLLLAGAGAGLSAAGAWGTSIVALAGMAAACLVLAWAAATAPPGRQRASDRRVHMLPEGAEPLRLGARLTTFVLVALVATIVSAALAVSVGHVARLAGWSAADSTVTALLAMPLTWSAITFFLTLQPGRASQIKVLAISSAPVVLVLALGAFA